MRRRLALAAAAVAGASCLGGDSASLRGADPGEAVIDEPGDHGASQAWVHCPHRIKEDVADPLGPVIAHGFTEAPGYEEGLFDEAQLRFVRRASLRTRDDGGPNTVLYEDLDLGEEPTKAEIAHLVTGAIKLAGKRTPAEATVGLFHRTAADDGKLNALPQFRIWDVQFREGGVPVSGALCQLIAPPDSSEGCQEVCEQKADKCSTDCDGAAGECEWGCDGNEACLSGCDSTREECGAACSASCVSCDELCRAAVELLDGSTLTCRLPVGDEPLSFEPFAISRSEAEQIARAVLPPVWLTSWEEPAPAPGALQSWSIAADSFGHVYLTDLQPDGRCLRRLDSDGSLLAGWGWDGSANSEDCLRAADVAVDAAGNVYLVDAGRGSIRKYDLDGNVLATWSDLGAGDGQLSEPAGVAVDSSGADIYVADRLAHRIVKLDSDGGLVAQWGEPGAGDGQLYQPTKLAVGPDGSVYVADGGNHRIQRFDGDGGFVAEWPAAGAGGDQLGYPHDIEAGEGGSIYVVDGDNHRIRRYNGDGTLLAEWGELGSGDGQLNAPRGVAVDGRGQVYVADEGNSRIAKLRRPAALITTSQRYEVAGDEALARFYIVAYDGRSELGVYLDGTGKVLRVTPRGAGFVFEGWDLDYSSVGFAPLKKLNTGSGARDVGVAQTQYLDTLPVIPSLQPQPAGGVDSGEPIPSCMLDLTSPSQDVWETDPRFDDTTRGFVICENDFHRAVTWLSPAAAHLAPRPPDNDFTQDNPSLPAVLPVRTPVLFNVGTGMSFSAKIKREAFIANTGQQEQYFGAKAFVLPIDVGAVDVAPWHHAELQAFYNAGWLQSHYQQLGHPRFCEWHETKHADLGIPLWCNAPIFCSSPLYDCDPWDYALWHLLDQDPYRLEIIVHYRPMPGVKEFHNGADAGLHYVRMGDWQIAGAADNDAIESIADMPFFHEYQHHVFYSLADMLSMDSGESCWQGQISVKCARNAVEEGLADAFASLWTGHAYGPRSLHPVDPQPCADPTSYPTNVPLGVRHACNDIAYGYWGSGNDYNNHIRGSITYHALYSFQRRFLDGGFGYNVPGQYIYQAQKQLSSGLDEEHHLLEQMVALLPSRHRQLATLAFAEKNVFPCAPNAISGCGRASCSSSPQDCYANARSALGIAGPLNARPWVDRPSFSIFAPRGPFYEDKVRIDLSTTPTFNPVGPDDAMFTHVELPDPNPDNGSPAGFYRWPVGLTGWTTVGVAALKKDPDNPKVYYRLRQCQKTLSGSGLCVASVQAATSDTNDSGVPYVLLKDTAVEPGCSYSGGQRNATPLGLLLMLWALGRGRRRKVRES